MDDKELEKQRNDANNANTVKNAADVAIASKNPYAMAAGGAVKVGDKLTGGKVSEGLGKAMTKANQVSPGGKSIQNASNKLAESGAGDKIGTAASMKSGGANKGAEAANKVGASKAATVNDSVDGIGGVRNKNTLPSSSVGVQVPNNDNGSSSGSGDSNSRSRNDDNKSDGGTSKGNGLFSFGSPIVRMVVIAFLPGFLVILFVLVLVLSVTSTVSEYEDGIGVNEATGGSTGNMHQTGTKEQQAYYERVNDVKLEYQAQGKYFDATYVAAAFSILRKNGAKLNYDDIKDGDIKRVADAYSSDEDTLKENLKSDVIPHYISGLSNREKDAVADEIIEYINNYNSLVLKESNEEGCTSTGTCSYDVKGYYISGKGNVTDGNVYNNLYVRLMQCGTGNGHNYGGTFGQPLEGEELVPFEKYVLGVAYQEIGPDAPKEAIKAQMIAARSFILGRHADMGGWRTLKQESDGKWVLQVASCTQDQVYCDPDQGCSGTDGQWGQVYSGTGHGSFSRGPMSADSPLRTYANETAGEVLVNSSGYIIYTGYNSTLQNEMISLANSGKDYKQILLQVYNQGQYNYGAASIQKNSCGGSQCMGAASGDYANWKQYRGSWINVPVGNSGSTIRQIGCLVTSVAMQVARSGVQTNISDFNPGTFVQYLNSHNGFDSGGNFYWNSVTSAAPSFKYMGQVSVSGLSQSQKLSKIKELISQGDTYVVAEVKGNTGQHWVAINTIEGSKVTMMDPGSDSTDLWAEYNWNNTSTLAYFKVVK